MNTVTFRCMTILILVNLHLAMKQSYKIGPTVHPLVLRLQEQRREITARSAKNNLNGDVLSSDIIKKYLIKIPKKESELKSTVQLESQNSSSEEKSVESEANERNVESERILDKVDESLEPLALKEFAGKIVVDDP